MKTTFLAAGVLIAVFALTASTYAVGQSGNAQTGVQAQQQTQTANQGEDSQVQTQTNLQTQNGTANQAGSGTQTQQQLQGGSETGNGAQNQMQNQGEVQGQVQAKQGEINLEQHRSAVANAVQGLLQVADRQGGIGQQVRTIAQQQNQSVDTTVTAMEKVQTRSKIKTFFLGSDYKNLGTLRSEMVQTENRLEQLNSLMTSVQNQADKTELQNQIQTLEQEELKIENFIKAQEGKFSLFGWAARLFNR